MKRWLLPTLLFAIALGVTIYGLASRQPVPLIAPEDLGISGQLLLASAGSGLVLLDLESGEMDTVFMPPERGTVRDAALSPDRSQIVMAYAPPPAQGPSQPEHSSLYLLPMDGGAPTLLIAAGWQESLFGAAWSADGNSVLYGRMRSGALFGLQPNFSILRWSESAAEPEVIQERAHSPAPAPDRGALAYVAVGDGVLADDLVLGEMEGSESTVLVGAGRFAAVDAPSISPDGQSVIFSGADRMGASRGDGIPQAMEFFGVGVAQAHEDLPSDVWVVPTTGGEPTRLTALGTANISVDYSPDGRHIVFVSESGLFVMRADGRSLAMVLTDEDFLSVDWVE